MVCWYLVKLKLVLFRTSLERYTGTYRTGYLVKQSCQSDSFSIMLIPGQQGGVVKVDKRVYFTRGAQLQDPIPKSGIMQCVHCSKIWHFVACSLFQNLALCSVFTVPKSGIMQRVHCSKSLVDFAEKHKTHNDNKKQYVAKTFKNDRKLSEKREPHISFVKINL